MDLLRSPVGRALAVGLAVWAVAGESRAADPGPSEAGEGQAREAPTAETAATLESRLLDQLAGGTLTDELIALFPKYALARARERFVPDVAPEDFWFWLEHHRQRDIREGLLVMLHPDYDPHLMKCLVRLKRRFDRDVDSYPQLSLALTAVYGRAGEGDVRDPELADVTEGLDEPSLEESFAYYLKHESAMRLSLKERPWPILAYVVNNDASITERLWALDRYRKMRPHEWCLMAGNVHHDKRRSKIKDREYTLQNIYVCGGSYHDQAYFGSRVLKSFGIPGIISKPDRHWSQCHAVIYVGPARKGTDLLYDRKVCTRCYTAFCPLRRCDVNDADIRLLVAAMACSYEKYLDARIACHLYEMLPPDRRAQAIGLLEGALKRNSCCKRAWDLLVEATVEGLLQPDERQRVFDLLLQAYALHPGLSFDVLTRVFHGLAESSRAESAWEIDVNLFAAQRAVDLYAKLDHAKLVTEMRYELGQYLEFLDRPEGAMKLYMAAAKHIAEYVDPDHWLLKTVDAALALMGDEKYLRVRIHFLADMVQEVPMYAYYWDKESDRKCRAYKHVVKAYIEALREAGLAAEAMKWETSLQQKVAKPKPIRP